MCLAVPGKIVAIIDDDAPLTMGKVSFGGVVKEICLAYVPEAQIDDYVLVHAGFAISKVEEQEAQQVFAYLQQIGEIEEEKRRFSEQSE